MGVICGSGREKGGMNICGARIKDEDEATADPNDPNFFKDFKEFFDAYHYEKRKNLHKGEEIV
jgi:hypothetical protein